MSNQKIRIDSHLRNVPVDWNDQSQNIHLHKERINGKRGERYDIRIPLNPANNTVVIGINGLVPTSVAREIHDVLDDERVRHNFIEDLQEALTTINWDRNDAPEVARRIAFAFGIAGNEFQTEFVDAVHAANQELALMKIEAAGAQRRYVTSVNKEEREPEVIIAEFQPFNASGLKRQAAAQWNDFLWGNLEEMAGCETVEELRNFLNANLGQYQGIGQRTVEDTVNQLSELLGQR